jgi:hypothetical protein
MRTLFRASWEPLEDFKQRVRMKKFISSRIALAPGKRIDYSRAMMEISR